MSWTHSSTKKKKNRSLISQLFPRTVFSDLKHCDITTDDLWRQVNVKYWHCEIILCQLFLYAQIYVKPIFTSE